MRYYLSGPMTGLPDLNYPAFMKAATALREAGYEVYNPAEWEMMNAVDGVPAVFNLRRAFADYCSYISLRADAVVVLPGWENSPGASAEVALARAIGLPVLHYATGGPVVAGPAVSP